VVEILVQICGFYHLPLLIGGQAGGYGNPTMVSMELKDGDKLTVFFFTRNGFQRTGRFFRLWILKTGFQGFWTKTGFHRFFS